MCIRDRYDVTGFQCRLDADAQKTRFLVHKAEWAKQEKRDKLAEKKAAERLEESLLDPEIVKLRKEMAQLKTAVTGKGSKTAKAAKASNNSKDKQKPKKKGGPGGGGNNSSSSGNNGKAKNASGPGKQGGRRGPKGKQPAKDRRAKAAGSGGQKR